MRTMNLDPRRWFNQEPVPKRGGKAASRSPNAPRARAAASLTRTPTWRETLLWHWRRHRRTRQAVLVSLCLCLAIGGLSLFGVAVQHEAARISLATIERVTIAAGFELESIVVTGRQRTDREQILAAIGVTRGGAILSADPATIRERLESLDWIDSARVRRILPGRIEVEIHEAVPFAVWQQEGKFILIDAKGRRITENNVDSFAHLPLVVGPGAADKAAELFAMLETEPTLKNRVQAAVRVGDRRWNIRFDNGVDLMLPETGHSEAWHKFAKLENEHRLLARAISHVDMRLKDKLVVRLTEDGMKTMRAPGRST